MDWHFRVHQRIVEAEKRGQHRSWYVDQAVSILSLSPPPMLRSSATFSMKVMTND